LARLVWLPIGKPPDQLIDLETALERVVAAKYGVGFIAEWTPATLRGEYEAQPYGGVRTLAWEQARAWVLEHLQGGNLQMLKVAKANSPGITAASADFWRSSNHADRQRQQLILERREDPSGISTYALDATRLLALLDEDASYVTAAVAKQSAPSRPETEAATRKRNAGRRGRKKGSGTKDDTASLRAMLDLLADGSAPSVTAAAGSFVKSKMDVQTGDSETSAQNWITRLRRKFAAIYGTEPPLEKTWDDVRREIGEQ
jgi:hypothetical protein